MAQPDDPRGSLTHVGNATVLLRCAGFTVLTDPNFLHRGERAYLGYGLWSKRLTEPTLDVGSLPPLDAVVLSHLHGDHFDRRARYGLDRDVPILTTRQAAGVLGKWGFGQARALACWESWTATREDGSELRVTSLPGKHAFGVLGTLLPPVMGSLLEFTDGQSGSRYRVYVTGDTLVHDALDEIGRRLPNIELGILHLGGTKILGTTVTMDARQGIELLRRVPVGTAVPVHYDDYGVFKSPLEDFTAEAARGQSVPPVLVVPRGVQTPLPDPSHLGT